jgi:lysophospholipase L1-like esterase
MKKILCYGDSNTWGFIAGSFDEATGNMERYSDDIRWTSLLQKKLGDCCLIIEEGLCGRNTNIDTPPELGGEDCNGKKSLLPCLISNAPLDWVVLMLGVNDFKTAFNRSAEDAVAGLEELVQMIQANPYGQNGEAAPQILLLASPLINEQAGIFADYFGGADEKSKCFPNLCAVLAEKYNCAYLDMSLHAQMSAVDGLHLDKKAHLIFAEKIIEKIVS